MGLSNGVVKSQFLLSMSSPYHLSHQDIGHFRTFIHRGGLLNLPSGNGYFPLHLASYKGDVEMVAFLMENMSPEDINHPGFGGCTAIHVAVLMGHLPVVSILASKGASLIVSIITPVMNIYS